MSGLVKRKGALAAAVALVLPAMALAQGGADLDRLADQVEHAMQAGDASGLPKAEGFRYTENGQQLDVWDGMWNTLSAVEGVDARLFPAAADLTYRVELVDGDEALRLVETDEQGVQGVAFLRLKATEGALSELEVLPVREEFSGARGGTVTLLQPAMLVTMDGARVGTADPLFSQSVSSPMGKDALIGVAESYLRSIVSNDASGVSFAEDCQRRDNGVPTTGQADAEVFDPAQPDFKPFALGCGEQVDSGFFTNIQRLRGLRSWADPERGLVLSVAQLDNPGTAKAFTAPGVGTVTYPGPPPMGDGNTISVAQQFDGNIRPNMIAPVTVNGAYLFKIEDGAIRRIDAFYRGAPYGMRSGW